MDWIGFVKHGLDLYNLSQIHVLQIHVLQIRLLQIHVLQIHVLQIQSMFYNMPVPTAKLLILGLNLIGFENHKVEILC